MLGVRNRYAADMRAELRRRYRFAAARFLPALPEGHPCRRMHGHTFDVEIRIEGPVDARTGLVLDFADVDAAVAPLLAAVEHRTLNDVAGLENPTSERIATWLWQGLAPHVPGLAAVLVTESDDSTAVVRGA